MHASLSARRVRGFSLIELVVVITLLSVVAAIATPRATESSRIGLLPRAEQLASDLRYAQALSMSNGQRYCVTFAANNYSITTASSNCTSTVVTPAGTQQMTLQNVTLTLSGLPANYVVFDGKGAPYVSAGASPTPLASAATLTLAADGSSAILTVVPMTGLVTGP